MQHQSLVIADEDILGGVLVFVGTRVPVKALFDYLKADHPLGEFLEDFPTVGRGQAEAVLEMSQQQWQAQEERHEASA